ASPLRGRWRQVVAALAVLTSGAAYVPIDPELPRARRLELLEDTRAVLIIDDRDAAPDAWPDDTVRVVVPAKEDPTVGTAAPPAVQRSQDLAYLIYTSGSTGKPKGVMIDHRGALNTIADLEKRIDLRSQDRVFGLSSLSFDLSVWDLFGTLASGAALVLPDAARRQYPSHWLDCIRRHGISVWNSVPALMQLLLSELEEQDATRESGASADALPLRLAMLSGDWIPLALPPQLGRLLPEVKLLSLGGATEASIWSISHALPHPLTLPLAVSDPSWRSVPYGRPMDGQSWYVLDESQQPCPPWVTGELHIGGAGVALGYWRRPGLSAERFIPNPLPGKANAADPVLYRTGDLGRFRPDGGIEFLGREDQQVKIRGHRIELVEIEHVLTEQDGIGAAVVNTYGEAPELVAYVVPELGADDRSPASPLEKLMLKAQRTATGTSETAGIALPAVPELSFERQSHRRFLPEPIALEEFADLLGTMSAQAIAGAPAPKYRYPSAGSLYPVALYLSVKADRVAGLPAGWYRYEPLAHRLVDVSCTLSPAATALFSASPDAAEASAFSLFLVGDLAAIEPVYGDRARDFCLLEAGYMGQLLMGHAPARELGLCPLSDPGMGQLHEALALEEKQVVLHALVGGAIDGSWSQRWMALEPEDQVSFEERLQNQLRSRLPAYLVPTRFVLLEQLPLTANGKVDRSRLPAPDAGASAAYRAPETALDRRIVELWEQVLNLPQVGMDDNFFQLGGNSLLAMQLLSGLRRLGAADVSIGELFAALTPASQAALLDGRAVDAGAAEAETVEAPAAIPRVSRSAEGGIEADVTAGLSDADVDQMLSQLLDEPRAPIDDAADPPDSSDT
ncbi:MAG: amino acid adenylation domain-containing protein, partial [Pseudomonadota bacterium]